MIRICPTRYRCASCGAAIEDWQHKHCEACNACACGLCLTLGPDREWYCPGDREPLVARSDSKEHPSHTTDEEREDTAR